MASILATIVSLLFAAFSLVAAIAIGLFFIVAKVKELQRRDWLMEWAGRIAVYRRWFNTEPDIEMVMDNIYTLMTSGYGKTIDQLRQEVREARSTLHFPEFNLTEVDNAYTKCQRE